VEPLEAATFRAALGNQNAFAAKVRQNAGSLARGAGAAGSMWGGVREICGDELCTVGLSGGFWCNGRPLTY
jgi:hypothetical protein